MISWEKGIDFLQILKENKNVTSKINLEELNKIFDIRFPYQKH